MQACMLQLMGALLSWIHQQNVRNPTVQRAQQANNPQQEDRKECVSVCVRV